MKVQGKPGAAFPPASISCGAKAQTANKQTNDLARSPALLNRTPHSKRVACLV
jgi:hypothetical protein